MLNKSIIKHIMQGALTKNNMSFYILLGSHYTYYNVNRYNIKYNPLEIRNIAIKVFSNFISNSR